MRKPSRTSQFVTILPLARRGYHHVNLTVGGESFQVSIGGHKKREAAWIKERVCRMLDKIVADELRARRAGTEFNEALLEGLRKHEKSKRKRIC